MASLAINFWYSDLVKNSIDRTVSAFESRRNDYDGIVRSVNNIPSNTNNLQQCNYYIRKKNEKLTNKVNKLKSFKSKISSFSTNAKEADKRVSRTIRDDSYKFYDTIGIKQGFSAAWNTIVKGAETVAKNVKEFYEKHKYIIDLVVDVASVVLAVVAVLGITATTGGFATAFIIFGLLDALGDLAGSGMAAYYHYVEKDDSEAERWSDIGLKDGFQYLGKLGDNAMGKFGIETNLFESLTGFAYDVISIANIGYGMYKGAEKIKDIFKKTEASKLNKLYASGREVFGFKRADFADKKQIDKIRAIKKITKIKNTSTIRRTIRGAEFVKNVDNGRKIITNHYDGKGYESVKFIKDLVDIKDTVVEGVQDGMDVIDNIVVGVQDSMDVVDNIIKGGYQNAYSAVW